MLIVPSINSVRRRIPTDSECLRIASMDAYDSHSSDICRPPKPSRQDRVAPRTHCASAPSCGTRAQARDPAPADPHGPALLGLALSRVARLPGCRRHRQAGDRHPLAPKGLSVVPDMEIQAATEGPAPSAPRGEGCEERAAHPRRAAQAGDRDRPATVSKVMVRHPRPPSQKRSSTCLLVSKHSSRRKRITSGTPGSKQLPTLASPDSPGW